MKELLILIISLLVFSCNSKKEELFYPKKSEDMAEGIYQKYKSKLDSAYANRDHFEVGVQLSNLKASSGRVFIEIENGIKSDSENCYRIYEWHKLFKEDNFQTNLVKTDTTKFIETYKLCEKRVGKQKLIDYQTRKEIEYQKKIAKLKKLDSTKFDIKLKEGLRLIREDDQRYRIGMKERGITKVELDKLWDKQNELDSINLMKVERILSKGFPAKEKVGYEGLSTIWLVLHHQGDSQIRQKYLPILKQAVKEGNLGKGALETYKWRSELIELNNKASR